MRLMSVITRSITATRGVNGGGWQNAGRLQPVDEEAKTHPRDGPIMR
jgi:hypothetical protein